VALTKRFLEPAAFRLCSHDNPFTTENTKNTKRKGQDLQNFARIKNIRSILLILS
jgi:hypothetical protein